MSQRVPFTILTGFLGAGKTTVLNRLLAAPVGRRVAVLVNELGRIAIDSRLILSRGGDVLELAGGCVCCSVDLKNDLVDGILDVIARSRPDHVVLETTGIAEPPALLDHLRRMGPEARRRIGIAGVVCVVDATCAIATLARRKEAVSQVESADRLLLTKLDIAPAEAVEAVHARLEALRPDVERAAFPRTADGDQALVPWLLERRQTRARSGARAAHHEHQVVAASFVSSEPLLASPLLALLGRLEDRLLRVKGFVHLADEPRRAYLERAGTRTTLDYGEEWADQPRRTELVLIGEGLDEAALRRQLWACRAAAG